MFGGCVFQQTVGIPMGTNLLSPIFSFILMRGRRGRDRMVVGFTNTSAISANHH
jgi:hypothetical protein